MKVKNFTRFGKLSGMLMSTVLMLVLSSNLNSQCTVPNNLSSLDETEDSALLQWESTNATPLTDHCWNIEVGGDGFTPGEGTAVVALTICEGDAGLSISGGTLEYEVTGLQPGTDYEFYVSETCDGQLGPNNTSGWSGAGWGIYHLGRSI